MTPVPHPTTSAGPVLVTGAAGFVGSALTGWLLAKGHAVVALDLDFGADRLPQDPRLERVVGDVRDAALVDALVARCARVAHLGAIAGVHHYLARTFDVLDVNILGTRTVLEAAARHGRPTLLASTSETYGKSGATLEEHGDSVLGPSTNARWCYAVSKLAAEHYAWAHARAGLPVTAVRYFNVYGPLLDAPGEGRVLAQFLGRLRAGRPLALVDGGHAVRCFCYVDDAVEATGRMLLALAPDSPLVGRPFNVGRPEPVTMRRLAELVVGLSGHAPGVEDVSGMDFFGRGFEDIEHRVPDTSDLEVTLGWHAATDLVTGLTRVLAHHGLLADAPNLPPTEPVPVIRPVYDADEALLDRYRAALRAGRTTNAGPEVTALEHEAGAWLGVDGLLAVGSGADGLELAVRGLGARGRAILPSFTYVSTLNAAELVGLEPLFCDIDPHTWTMDPEHLAELLATHDDVGVVLAVNVFGVSPALDPITAVTRAYGVPLVLDAAHAIGTEAGGLRYDPRPDVTVWSLHATKVLPATEGGLVACRDPAVGARVAQLRTHGLAPDPLDSEPGRNAKMDELAAATARHGLARLEGILSRRRGYDARLRAALQAAGWTVQAVPAGLRTNGQNLAARPPGGHREAAARVLADHGVASRRYFHPALHHLRRFHGRFHLPVTDAVVEDLLNLPLHSRMSEADLARIEVAVRATGGP